MNVRELEISGQIATCTPLPTPSTLVKGKFPKETAGFRNSSLFLDITVDDHILPFRYLIRVEEMRQSLNIIEQVRNKLTKVIS